MNEDRTGSTGGTTVSFRVSASTADEIESAAQERGWLKSQLLRRAYNYYARENPDNLLALDRGVDLFYGYK